MTTTDPVTADRAHLLAALVDLAAHAGDIVWDHFTAGCDVEVKGDESPVTAADRDGERIILAGLAKIAPAIPVVAEEQVAEKGLPSVGHVFFLVDPLDGTKEFINRGTDFTVNIGLIEHGTPTLGVVYAPARGRLYWGDTVRGEALTATRLPHGEREAASELLLGEPAEKLRAVASKSHNTPETEAWLAASGIAERVSVGSSLKFLMVASGDADVYPRPAPTMEWDTAAGDAILRAAGGAVLDLDGAPLRYAKERFFNPGFVATGRFAPMPLRPFLAEAEIAA